ncbi:MAG: patatin-like phospholipase family protein [Acidimicrobiaceae bacterium]|nr:patatin-like phospholipase family protein [Acidimicrobiaceae bacterium]
MERHRRVALVLGAGGPVGFAFHAGVLSALADAGWDARDARLVLGTSIGAATGALLRAGMEPADLMARAVGEPLSDEGDALVAKAGGWPNLEQMLQARDGRSPLSRPWRPPAAPALLLRLAFSPGRIRPGLVLAGLLPRGPVDAAPIVNAFDGVFGGGWPERDLWICATDLGRGTRVVFGAPGSPPTSVGTAVAASTAVPSVFAPVDVGGRNYVDGGAVSPVSTDVLAPALGALDAVVVSLPMGIGAVPGRCGFDLPGRWLNHRGAWSGLDAARRAGVPVLLVEPGPHELEVMGYDVFSLRHRAEIARRAQTAMACRLRRPGTAVGAVRPALGLGVGG